LFEVDDDDDDDDEIVVTRYMTVQVQQFVRTETKNWVFGSSSSELEMFTGSARAN